MTKIYSTNFKFKFKVVIEAMEMESQIQIARKYGIDYRLLSKWIKRFKEQGYKIFETDRDKNVKRLANTYSLQEARQEFSRWVKYYNTQRLHSSIDYRIPDHVFFLSLSLISCSVLFYLDNTHKARRGDIEKVFGKFKNFMVLRISRFRTFSYLKVTFLMILII